MFCFGLSVLTFRCFSGDDELAHRALQLDSPGFRQVEFDGAVVWRAARYRVLVVRATSCSCLVDLVGRSVLRCVGCGVANSCARTIFGREMTPKQQAVFVLHCIGGFLIALGLLTALLNWGIWRAQKRLEREGSTRHISMVALIGFALPLGCLFFPLLRVHALWVWLLDPFSAMLVLSLPLWLWQQLTRSRS